MNLPKEWLEAIVQTVSKEFEKQNRHKQESEKDWRLRNTEYLLRNYRKLRSHCDVEMADVTKNAEIFDKIPVTSVIEYKVKTIKMVEYVDKMIQAYANYCQTSGKAAARRFDVIDSLYIKEHEGDLPQREDLAIKHDIDVRTIHRDEKKAVDELSVYLFGITHFSDLVEEVKSEMSG